MSVIEQMSARESQAPLSSELIQKGLTFFLAMSFSKAAITGECRTFKGSDCNPILLQWTMI